LSIANILWAKEGSSDVDVPVFFLQKASDFSKIIVCLQSARYEGKRFWVRADICGQAENIFFNFVRTSFMDGSL